MPGVQAPLRNTQRPGVTAARPRDPPAPLPSPKRSAQNQLTWSPDGIAHSQALLSSPSEQ